MRIIITIITHGGKQQFIKTIPTDDATRVEVQEVVDEITTEVKENLLNRGHTVITVEDDMIGEVMINVDHIIGFSAKVV